MLVMGCEKLGDGAEHTGGRRSRLAPAAVEQWIRGFLRSRANQQQPFSVSLFALHY